MPSLDTPSGETGRSFLLGKTVFVPAIGYLKLDTEDAVNAFYHLLSIIIDSSCQN